MKHEKIIKREDGSKVKIDVRCNSIHKQIEFSVTVFYCAPKSRGYEDVMSKHSYKLYGLSLEEQVRFIAGVHIRYVTSDEILQAKRECWQLLEPKS